MNKAEIKDDVLTENTAQSVYNHLMTLQRTPDSMYRWIWELLQNARDAATAPNNLTASINYRPGELVFLHNGSGFKEKEIGHLIFHGSTKTEDEGKIGQYGSGFLTTHLLSWTIDVSGQLDDGRWFDFCLERKPDDEEALRRSMDEAWDNFNPSSSPIYGDDFTTDDNFTTRFAYPIHTEDAQKAVEEGIAMLKQCAPFVVVFNPEFSGININIDTTDCSEKLCFKVLERRALDAPGIEQITVTEDNSGIRKYLVAQGDKASVTVLTNDSSDCLSIGTTPRLFLGFPLVGTKSFSFPAVINSFKFSATPDREGVWLATDNDKASIENQKVIQEACALLVRLAEFAVSSGWHHIHQWVKVPPIENQKWLDTSWLKTCVKENLIEEIRKKPIVLNADDHPIDPKEVRLLLLESEASIQTFWDLCDGIKGQRKFLPKREEVAGWCNAIKSWADVYQDEPTSLFSEVMDGTKLASFIQESTRKDGSYGRIEDLQDLLLEGISAVEWLNGLHNFFNENELREAVHKFHIVPDQTGNLDKLSELYRDQDIDEELKEIAKLLNWRDSQNDWTLRQLLRDKQLTSLAGEVGAGNKDNEEVLGDLVQKLKELAEDNDNIDDNFKKASVRLFAWIVDQKDWNSLRGFPVFAKDSKSDTPIFDLPTARAGEPPLAPIRSWPEDLQQFSELFPPDRILDDAFFEALRSPDIWKMLDDEKKLIRWNMIICRDEADLKVLSPNPEVYEDNKTEHKAKHPISVTDIVELEKVLKEVVYDSRERGYKFWRFLTEWLVNKDIQGLEIVSEGASCECGKTHEYYPAAWVMLVRKVNWIRDGNPRHLPEAEHLAKLLQEKGWELSSLNENSGIGKLLKAMNVDPSTLKRLFIPDTVINTAVMLSENPQLVHHMEDSEKRCQIEQILNKVGDDLPLVHEAVQDEKFLEEYKSKKMQDITIQVNKDLGLLVEEIVENILDEKGFDVKSNHRGWDFDMTGHITELEVVQNSSSKTWRVEVKTTRTEGNDQGVYMSAAQAEEAVEYGKQYLLCIVPLGQEDAIPENVREKMRFIENIGNRVEPLCADLDRLKEVRDDITADTPSDLELIVEEGKPRVLVKKPIWDEVGFPLTDLLERLK